MFFVILPLLRALVGSNFLDRSSRRGVALYHFLVDVYVVFFRLSERKRMLRRLMNRLEKKFKLEKVFYCRHRKVMKGPENLGQIEMWGFHEF